MKQLFGHTAVYTVATVVSRSAQVAALVVFPLLLSPAQYGALGLFVALAALVTAIATLEISQGLGRNFAAADAADKPRWAGTAWRFTLAAMTLAAVVSLVFAGPLNLVLTGEARMLPAFRLAVGFFVANTLFLFVQHQLRWSFRPRDFLVASLLMAVFSFGLALVGALLAPDRLVGVMAGQTIGLGIALAWAAWRMRATLAGKFDPPKLRAMLSFSLPLVPASLAMIASVYASRVILGQALDLERVGIFTFASQIATIPSFLILGVQAALTPLVLAHHAEPQTPATIGRLFEAVFALGLVVCLGAGLATPVLIEVIGIAAYAGAGALVLVLGPAYLMQQMYVFFPGFTLASRTGLQMGVAILSGIVAVGANLALIGRFGLGGAAAATMVAAVAFLAVWCALSQPLYRVAVRWWRPAALAAACAVLSWLGARLPDALEPAVLVQRALIVAVAGGLAVALGMIERQWLARLPLPGLRRRERGPAAPQPRVAEGESPLDAGNT